MYGSVPTTVWCGLGGVELGLELGSACFEFCFRHQQQPRKWRTDLHLAPVVDALGDVQVPQFGVPLLVQQDVSRLDVCLIRSVNNNERSGLCMVGTVWRSYATQRNATHRDGGS